MMNQWKKFVAMLPVVLCGCVQPVTTSSRSYLSAAQSGARSDHDLRATALEVNRLFEVRGCALVEQHVSDDSGGLRLKFTKALRPLAVSVDHVMRHELGSVYYVWVEPAAAGSQLTIIGKPTLDESEPCSADTPQLECDGVSAPPEFAAAMSGRDEAATVHGILLELALEGFAAEPLALAPAAPAEPSVAPASVAASALCRAQRHAVFLKAAQLTEPAEREKLLKTAPLCA